jgi:hypothetical protein
MTHNVWPKQHISVQLTREEGVGLENAVGVHGEQLEALRQDELANRGLAGTVLAIAGENDSTLVSEVLTDVLVGHAQGCGQN